jgi:hypothetical protein
MPNKSLKEVLEEVAKIGFAKSGEGYNAEYPFGDNNESLPKCITKKELAQAISEIEGMIPAEIDRNKPKNDIILVRWIDGWNDCREAILANFKKEG